MKPVWESFWAQTLTRRIALFTGTAELIAVSAFGISTSLLAAPSETDRKDESEIGIGNGGRRRR